MSAESVRRRATELHAGGYNCAESVLVAVTEERGSIDCTLIPKIATCFGGGVGRTKEEMCGGLAGGLMAIGCVKGRSRQGENWDAAASASAEFRRRFLSMAGSTNCHEILEAFGPDHSAKCHALSGSTAALVREVLAE